MAPDYVVVGDVMFADACKECGGGMLNRHRICPACLWLYCVGCMRMHNSRLYRGYTTGYYSGRYWCSRRRHPSPLRRL